MKINEISLYFNKLGFHLSILPKSNYLPLCCFTGLAYADLKEITYKNIHTDSEGGTWLMGNRIKTGVAYVVKLLPIAIELVERYRGDNEKKSSPDKVFPVGEYQTMVSSLRVLTRKCGCSTEITPHIGKHYTFSI